MALIMLGADVALADAPRLVSYGTFASEGPGVAVDQPSGDVITAGLAKIENGNFVAPGRINRFSEEGKLIAPSPFGTETLYSGVAVNPTNRDLYVLDALEGAIDTYDPSNGELLSSFSAASARNLFGAYTLVQIAADSSGDVYEPVTAENEVLKYSPAGEVLQTFTGAGAGTLKEPTGVAVDSSGNLWVADKGNDRIEELSAGGSVIGEIKSEGVQSVALDGKGDIFAVVVNSSDPCGAIAPPCAHLLEYGASGATLADVGAGSFETVFGFPGMVAVDESTGRVYVADDQRDTMWMFGPPRAPELSRELVAEVGTTEAKLGALVNPGGIETSYRFEYGTTTAYGRSTPIPAGSVGQGVKARTVWASASELAPGTTYHYRVLASNELGTTVGADETFTTKTAAETSCPNEELRDGFSASLPDCRAYEMVTQPNDASAEPDTAKAARHIEPGGGIAGNYAAGNGERLAFRTAEAMPGASSSGYDYLATRGASGWTSEDLIPLQSYDGNQCTQPEYGGGNVVKAFSAELTESVLRVGAEQRFGTSSLKGGCGAEGVEVVQGEPLGVENLLLRNNTSGTYRLIDVPTAGVTPMDAQFQAASVDLSHVIFTENARLTANAPAGEDLYEWDEGLIRLVTILPGGTPVAGSLAPDQGVVSSRASVVSVEGARVFFTANGNLYVRINGESTAQLDEPQGGPGPGGGGFFQAASADGSQAFFIDEASAGLTNDTASGSGANLYRYANGHLTDLTPSEHAEVVTVSGISEDGSYVYFVADGVLSGSQANERGEVAQAGLPNMYLWHGGVLTFIADLSNEDQALAGAVRVSANGAFLAFSSMRELTGQDNVDANTGFTDPEVFLYSESSQHLICVSCSPSGEQPSTGNSGLFGGATLDGANGSPGGGTPHYLTDSGQVFFQTREALLPRDTNGQMDVYEYENGGLSLISSGTSSTQSWLIDVSESGDDVFFLGRQALVAQDTSPEELVIYDARIDGGFPAEVAPPSCTTADACRTPASSQPPIFGAPASQTFSGVGNLEPSSRAGARQKAKPKRNHHSNACKRKHNKRRRAACESQRRKKSHMKAQPRKGGK